MGPDELLGRAFSSDFVSESLCRERLGSSKLNFETGLRYLRIPALIRPNISLFFDSQYYCARYPDVSPEEMDPFLHFFAFGCAQGRSPHPLIDPGHMISIDEHLLPAGYGTDELHDVLRYDLADPSPYFLLTYYKSCLAAEEDTSQGLLAHFLSQGLSRGFKPNPLFDPLWYGAKQIGEPSDPSAALRQFVLQGDLEGRPASPAFSGARYFRRYPDIAEVGVPPLAHYLTHGKDEGRACLPEQDDAARVEALIEERLSASDATIDMAGWLTTYASLRERITTIRQDEKDSVSVSKPRLIHFAELERKISKLVLPKVQDPNVSILVPVFNEVSYTVECLASIIASKGRTSFEVVVADDASTDQSVGLLSKIRNLRIVRQETNVGFLENCNKAYRLCKGEFILLLNNDAQLAPGCLDAMIDALERNPGVAAVGPKILYPDGRLQEAGCTLDRDGISTMVGLFADPGRPEYNYVRQTHYCSGAALMVRRSEVGDLLFDDRFKPAYCEDADLCLRLLSRGRHVIYVPEARVVHHLSVSTDKQSTNRRLQTITRNQQKLTEKWSTLLEDINTTRVIAFYLPQFHSTPENDFHWGQGFTEWTNVAKATPGYVGHYQPHLPADLGFYDLRVRQAIERQSALAHRYGVTGFCVYYYNFGQRRALDQAFETIVADQTIPFPFCICWANENWTRHWDGGSREIIFEQLYDKDALYSVLRDAVRYAADPRYIRVNGKPLFLVYRPRLIPDPKLQLLQHLRVMRSAKLAIVAFTWSMSKAWRPPRKVCRRWILGSMAASNFHPMGSRRKHRTPLLSSATISLAPDMTTKPRFLKTSAARCPTTRAILACSPVGITRHGSRNAGTVLSAPRQKAFQLYIEEKPGYIRRFLVGEERLLFVNAWNEWAEGCHLEPDRKFGHRWLEAIRNALMVKSLA